MTRHPLRPELPPLPDRIATLPIDARGYPVPWFVAWVDDQGKPLPRGQGVPDFRVADGKALASAIKYRLCWVCGERLGAHLAFLIGPMCAVNRTSSEPPAHLECADFSARACPFLNDPTRPRREKKLPEMGSTHSGSIKRNPGVALVWVTKKVRLVRTEGRVLFKIGDPEATYWYAHGRAATRAEILESFQSGLPILEGLAEQEGPEALAHLAALKSIALGFIPETVSKLPFPTLEAVQR